MDRFPAVLCRGAAESFIFQSVDRSLTAHKLLWCEQGRVGYTVRNGPDWSTIAPGSRG